MIPTRHQQEEMTDSREVDHDTYETKSSHSSFHSSSSRSYPLIIPSLPSPSLGSPSCPPPLSPSRYSSPRWYQVGDVRMQWGHQLREMIDSTPHLSHPPTLRANLHRDGYLLLRHLLPPSLVLSARAVVTSTLHHHFRAIDTSHHPHSTAAILPRPTLTSSSCPPHPAVLLTGYAPVTHHPQTLRLLHSSHLSSLFQVLFAAPPSTFNTKWVRVMSHAEYTDEHTDYFRFQHNPHSMLTCWIPLGTYPKHHGTLAICHTSHHLIPPTSSPPTHSEDVKSDDPPDLSGRKGEARELPLAYDQSPRSAFEWHTTDFDVGDVVVFDIRAVHASTANETRQFRISMDTRWQPKHLTMHSQRHAFTPL